MSKINNVHKIIGYLNSIADDSNEYVRKRILKEIIPTINLLSLDAKYHKMLEAKECNQHYK